MRGLAALTVVLQHFRDMWMPDDVHQAPHWVQTASTLTKPFWSGSESVLLFFVLSGLVLALPLARGKRMPYPRFALRRVIRIMGPYWIAITLAIVAAALLYSHMGHRNAWSADTWAQFPQGPLVLQHYLFLGAYDTSAYDPVIWSLVHELRISLIFPLLFLMVQRGGIAVSALYAALSTFVAAYVISMPVSPLAASLCQSLHYSGLFVVGILLALHRQGIRRRWQALPFVVKGLVTLGSLLLFSYPARIVALVLGRVVHHPILLLNPQERMASNWLACAAAAGWIVLALSSEPVRRFLVRPVCHMLGRISYSMYLVHLIVLYVLTSLLGNSLPLPLQFCIFVSLAVGCGWVFSRWVEEPAIWLARSV